MNDQSNIFFVTVDPDELNIHLDQRLSTLFPDNRTCVVMPRENWPSYPDMNLGKAQVSLNADCSKILVTAFDLAGQPKEEKPINLRPDEPENMRFQIQYALGQLGALPLSNGNYSGTVRPSLNIPS